MVSLLADPLPVVVVVADIAGFSSASIRGPPRSLRRRPPPPLATSGSSTVGGKGARTEAAVREDLRRRRPPGAAAPAPPWHPAPADGAQDAIGGCIAATRMPPTSVRVSWREIRREPLHHCRRHS
jgi:hypothetical protein